MAYDSGRGRRPSPVLLAIFGAGASYDSSPTIWPGVDVAIDDDRPPLANQLFDARHRFSTNLRRFPECLGLIANLRHPFPDTVTVEQQLDQLLEEAGVRPERHIQLMAIRYYLHLTLTECINHWANVHGGVENYTALLDHIEQWRVRTHGRVILVTFNYDTMIERALTGRGISTKNLDGYISDDRYKLIKVHGSVNWARDVTAPTGLAYNAESLIQAAPRLQFGTWWIAPQYPVAYIQKPGVGNVPAVPAIALPLQSKRAFECPGQHLDVLKDHLPEVSRCLIIGWRGNEPHFTSLLLDGLKPGVQWLISVGHRRDGSEVVQRLQNLGLPGKFSDSDLSFSDFIVRRETYKFLSD